LDVVVINKRCPAVLSAFLHSELNAAKKPYRSAKIPIPALVLPQCWKDSSHFAVALIPHYSAVKAVLQLAYAQLLAATD